MPLQNRVTPLGELVANPGRGLVYGNRGCLHDADGRIRRRFAVRRWIACRLRFKDWHRTPLMQPGRFTELFFLDEATALAAGHRPCGYCRRADYLSFAHAWRSAQRRPQRPRAIEMDARLHSERVDPRTRRQRIRPARFAELPDAAMVRYNGQPALVRGGEVLPWTFAGYADPIRVAADTSVDLLTPPSSVAALAAGYRPLLHPSAR